MYLVALLQQENVQVQQAFNLEAQLHQGYVQARQAHSLEVRVL